MISFDDVKRSINLGKHGIDLAQCAVIFDAPMLTEEDAHDTYGEQRLRSLGWFNERVVMLIWTDRKNGPHLISCRYGDKYETRCYSKPLFSEAQMASALAVAPEKKQGEEDSLSSDWSNAVVSYSLDELRSKIQSRQSTSEIIHREQIAIHLSPEVLTAFRASGADWQSRIDEALKDWLKTHSPVA